jgi:hypothetical protein
MRARARACMRTRAHAERRDLGSVALRQDLELIEMSRRIATVASHVLASSTGDESSSEQQQSTDTLVVRTCLRVRMIALIDPAHLYGIDAFFVAG